MGNMNPAYTDIVSSLHATFLRNRIVATIRAAEEPAIQRAATDITQNLVFEYPTLRELAAAIAKLVDPAGERETRDLAKDIDQLVEHYSIGLPKDVRESEKAQSAGIIVLLTGSTGNIGSHILAALLAEPRVSQIYTLNRQTSSTERQKAAFAERGLPVNLLSKITLVQLFGDLSLDSFGLVQGVYDQVSSVLDLYHHGVHIGDL